MAKISAEEKQKKKAELDAHIYQIFITEGWDAITYERIASDFGTRKSSIQRYYEKRLDFGNALQGKILPEILPLLDFSTRDRFVTSWLKALEYKTFQEVNKLLIEHATGAGTGGWLGVNRLLYIMKETMTDEDADSALTTCLGHSVLFFLKRSMKNN